MKTEKTAIVDAQWDKWVLQDTEVMSEQTKSALLRPACYSKLAEFIILSSKLN